jgi:protoporphyrinogen oxidase
MKQDTIVIVGGGFSGLVSALWAAEKSNFPVVLLERDSNLGGLYSSIDAGGNGLFDHGPHLFYESGNAEIDSVLQGILPESDWIYLAGNRKDIAGTYHAGNLQHHSHYVDLRRLNINAYKQCIAEFFSDLTKCNITRLPYRSAKDYFDAQFGAHIVDLVVEPILNKLWRSSADALDPIAAKIVSMDRVILFDENTMQDLMKSDLLRSRLAFPDQTHLPMIWRTTPQRGYYPKKFGLSNLVSTIRQELKDRGVAIYTNASIEHIQVDGMEVREVRFASSSKSITLSNIRVVHWTAGYQSLAKQLGVNMSDVPTDAPAQVVYVNVLLRSLPNMGQSYYVYCFDDGFRTFRVTNYVNYCAGAERAKGFPVSMELHFPAGNKINQAEVEKIARDELLSLNLIAASSEIVWCGMSKSVLGFPVPTLRNKHFSATLENRLSEICPSNITCVGASFSKGHFFLHEMLAESYNVLSPWCTQK